MNNFFLFLNKKIKLYTTKRVLYKIFGKHINFFLNTFHHIDANIIKIKKIDVYNKFKLTTWLFFKYYKNNKNNI